MTLQKPNILFIMADQLIPFLTGAYGHPVVKTPNLDRLAAAGVRFDAAYSPCPVCAPARAALMTGKYISNIGVWDNAASFSCEEPTLAHYLTVAGYDTVLSGKMHFVGADQLHGFSRRLTTNLYPAEFDWVPVRDPQNQESNRHALQYVGQAIHVGRWSQYLSGDEETQFRALEYLHAQGLEWAEKRQEGQLPRPFFLCVSYHHPHEPFWPRPEFWALYEDEDIEVPDVPDNLEETYSTLDRWLNIYHGIAKAKNLRHPDSIRLVRRAYYACVTYVDHKVGQLLDSLEENGLIDNTIVVFTSDHGDMLCERGMVQKRAFYEWSSRVPLLIYFPDGRWAGEIRPQPVNLIDLLPTVLDLAGVPDDKRLPVDGRSLRGLLGDGHSAERITFSEYHAQGSHAPCFMVRQGKFKYVYIHGYDTQLFDLEADPGEWHNLAGQPAMAGIEAGLKALILDKFDPQAIDAAVEISVRRRWLLNEAMNITGTRWDAQPFFDPTKSLIDQYLAGKPPSKARRGFST